MKTIAAKATATFACACALLLAGCHSDLPPPITGPSYKFGANTVRPVKMVYVHRQFNLCPDVYKDALVDLNFIIEPDGSVSHIRVVNENPKNCGFADDAVYAFRSWKFPPYLEKGVAVPHEAHYGFTFKTY